MPRRNARPAAAPELAKPGVMGRGCFCGTAPGVVVVGSCVPRMFSCFYPVAGVTLWPFIFVSPDVPEDEMAVMVKCEA